MAGNSGPNEVHVVDYEAVTSLGTTWTETQSRLHNRESGLTPENIHGQSTMVGRVNLEPPADRVPRYHQLATEVLVHLVENLGIIPDQPLGLVAATSKGGLTDFDVRSVTDLHNPGIWSARLGEAIPPVNRVATPSTACATGLTALIHASRWITHGELPHAIVIASESSFEKLLMAGYKNMGALCGSEGMRPFHPDRDGFALSEGAAAIYLRNGDMEESSETTSPVHITGWAETNDAHHITDVHPDGRGLHQAIQNSLSMAGIDHEQVELLHAHLTTTQGNDQLEQDVIDNWPGPVKIQGIKPTLGHTVGAAGLIEALATADVLKTQRPFPISPEPQISLPDHPGPYRSGLTWNLGFGGHYAALVMEKNPVENEGDESGGRGGT